MKAQIVYNEFCGLRLRLKSSYVITSLLNEEGPTCQRTRLTNTPYPVIHTDPTTDRYGQMPNQGGCIITDVAIRPFTETPETALRYLREAPKPPRRLNAYPRLRVHCDCQRVDPEISTAATLYGPVVWFRYSRYFLRITISIIQKTFKTK